MEKIIFLILLLFFIGGNKNSIFAQCGGSWRAPRETKGIENPLEGDIKSILNGEKIYTQMCVICHGENGKGNGIASSGLSPKPANFTSHMLQSQKDGEIFWKLSNGKGSMVAFKELLTETQRWEVLNYIRTFK